MRQIVRKSSLYPLPPKSFPKLYVRRINSSRSWGIAIGDCVVWQDRK